MTDTPATFPSWYETLTLNTAGPITVEAVLRVRPNTRRYEKWPGFTVVDEDGTIVGRLFGCQRDCKIDALHEQVFAVVLSNVKIVWGGWRTADGGWIVAVREP